jgi:outer membrane protein OmpA-like peptidoglycan-associated protein
MRSPRSSSFENDHEESFFVSMTDMMVGMIFMFIIMLMFFALKFNDDSSDLRQEKDRLAQQNVLLKEEKHRLNEQLLLLQGAVHARDNLVENVYRSLKAQGVNVMIDIDNGILRLPESILFPVNKAELTPDGNVAVRKLASALSRVLPCYSQLDGEARPADCPANAFGLEALLVEGHTDSDGREDLNWRLSMERALHTYHVLTSEQPLLTHLFRWVSDDEKDTNGTKYPLLSVAGYGMTRPIALNDTQENKNRNRRIDLRFIMSPPAKVEINAAKRMVQ